MVQAELVASLVSRAIAHFLLAQCLHVVRVESDRVTQPALEDEGMRAVHDELIGIAAHNAERDQSVDDDAGGVQVNVTKRYSRLDRSDGPVLRREDQIVYRALTRVELAADRERSRDVAGIADGTRRARIADHEIAPRQGPGVAPIVQYLAAP